MATGTFLSGVLVTGTPGLSDNVPGEHVLPQGARGGWDLLSAFDTTFLIDSDGAQLVDADGALLIDASIDLPLVAVRYGSKTDARPLSIRSLAKTGNRAATFVNDWYNRVHVLPRIIDFGAVSGGAQRSFILWNAYLSSSTLSTVTETGADTLTLTGADAGTVLKPLEFKTYTVAPDELGPATIDASYVFAFAGRPDVVSVDIFGRRARLWPFAPNWSSSVDMTLDYKTDIVTSRAGREQRRALRKSPRRRFNYTVTLSRGDERTLHRLMTQWQARTWLLPDPVRKVTVAQAAGVGETDIRVNREDAWLRVGQTVIVNETTVADVTAVDGVVVTIGTPLTAPLDAGVTVRPGLSASLALSLRVRHPSNATAEFNVEFNVDPGSEVEDAGSESMYVLGGREVFARKPNWGDAVESEFVWPKEDVDFGFGRTRTYIPQTFGAMIRRASFVQQGAEDIRDIEQFFCRQRGQSGEFLMPTWLDDLPPKFDLVEGTNFIRVEGTDVAAAYGDDPIYRAVAVILADGRQIFREVTTITAVSDVDGEDSVLYLNRPWFTEISRDEIIMVCWMPVMRMAADQLTIEWVTEAVAQTSVATRTLEALEPEDPVTEYDEAASWLLESEWGGVDIFDPFDVIVNVRYPEIVL